jgi:hypothetical protein
LQILQIQTAYLSALTFWLCCAEILYLLRGNSVFIFGTYLLLCDPSDGQVFAEGTNAFRFEKKTPATTLHDVPEVRDNR